MLMPQVKPAAMIHEYRPRAEGGRREIENEPDTSEEGDDLEAPADGLTEDAVPAVVTGGAVDKTHDDEQDGEVPVDAGGEEGDHFGGPPGDDGGPPAFFSSSSASNTGPA